VESECDASTVKSVKGWRRGRGDRRGIYAISDPVSMSMWLGGCGICVVVKARSDARSKSVARLLAWFCGLIESLILPHNNDRYARGLSGGFFFRSVCMGDVVYSFALG
jgi:hypothetical protein